MIEELKKNREITKSTAILIGSGLGYLIGREMKNTTIPTMMGGFIARVAVAVLLK